MPIQGKHEAACTALRQWGRPAAQRVYFSPLLRRFLRAIAPDSSTHPFTLHHVAQVIFIKHMWFYMFATWPIKIFLLSLVSILLLPSLRYDLPPCSLFFSRHIGLKRKKKTCPIIYIHHTPSHCMPIPLPGLLPSPSLSCQYLLTLQASTVFFQDLPDQVRSFLQRVS